MQFDLSEIKKIISLEAIRKKSHPNLSQSYFSQKLNGLNGKTMTPDDWERITAAIDSLLEEVSNLNNELKSSIQAEKENN